METTLWCSGALDTLNTFPVSACSESDTFLKVKERLCSCNPWHSWHSEGVRSLTISSSSSLGIGGLAMTRFKALTHLSQDTGCGHLQFMKRRPEEELLYSSLAVKSEATEPWKQKQRTAMSKPIGRPADALGQDLLSSIWRESVGKSRGSERSVCPLGEAE